MIKLVDKVLRIIKTIFNMLNILRHKIFKNQISGAEKYTRLK